MPNDSCCYENQLLNEEGEQTLPTHSLKPTRVSWSFCLSISSEDGEQRVLVKVSRAEITAGEVHALPSLILWPAWPISQTLPVNTLQPQPRSAFPSLPLPRPLWLAVPGCVKEAQLSFRTLGILTQHPFLRRSTPSALSGIDSRGLEKMNLSSNASSCPQLSVG